MPDIRVVSFDCAGTLVRVNWQPERLAVDSAAACGLKLDRSHAESEYRKLLQSRWRDYQILNLTKDLPRLDDFWRDLLTDWLGGLGEETSQSAAIFEEAWKAIYGPDGEVFSLFEDAFPTLELLEERGIRVAVLSNWDYSLHRVLRLMGLGDSFEVVIASLEEGIEKPERALFELMLERMGAKREETLHVGDDPLDDVQGAMGAGIHPCLIDRGGAPLLPRRITDLRQIAEVLDWTG